MSDSLRPEQLRLDPVRCPQCDEVTMPNQLADGSVVCSCTAERALPLDLVRDTGWGAAEGSVPPPVDAPAVTQGAREQPMPLGAQQSAGDPTAPQRPGATIPPHRGDDPAAARVVRLPVDRGQFGRDVASEDYQTLRPPPDR